MVEQGGHITYHQLSTEVAANCVKLQENLVNIGVRVVSQEATVAVLTEQKWLAERKPMHLPNTWHCTTLTSRATLNILTFR